MAAFILVSMYKLLNDDIIKNVTILIPDTCTGWKGKSW